MPRHFVFALALATLSASAAIAQVNGSLQNTYVAAPDADSTYSQQEPATIERAPARNRPAYSSTPRVTNTQVVPGVWLRSESGASVETVAADKHVAELRVAEGRINVNVHHPAQDTQILVDLPGGQTALLKDGVYTFNAEADTVHVLEGEAEAFPGNREGNGIKLKDDRMYAFGSGDAHATSFEPTARDTDLLAGAYPMGEGYARHNAYDGEYLYAGSTYYEGFGYPYYGFGYPYGYGYGYGPWGYGYPFGIGVGFGYYGGFGGFRGGYGGFGGFHGGGFGGVHGGGFRR